MADNRFWEKYFLVYDAVNLLAAYQELLETICQRLEIKPGDKVLEAGCGTGNLAIKIKERGAEVWGVDNCQAALDVCSKKDGRIKTVLADLTQTLPFPPDFFDKIASNNALYAIPQEKQLLVLKELFRVLKPGGMVAIANLKENWQPAKIYLASLVKNAKKEGWPKTLATVLKMAWPTLKMFYFNLLIQQDKNYHFFRPEEPNRLLSEAGFAKIAATETVYEDQGILVSGFKSA